MVVSLTMKKLKTVNFRSLQFFFLILLMLFPIIYLCSCISLSFQTNFVRGNGHKISSVLPISEFNSLYTSIPCNYIIIQSDTSTCRIEIDDNLIPFLNVSVVDSALFVKATRNFFTSSIPIVYITTPSLDSLVNLVESFIDLSLKTNRIVMLQNGKGTIKMKGNANEAYFTIQNSGEINAFDFPTSATIATANGFGIIQTTTDSLFARCSDRGKVEYKSNSSNSVFIRKILSEKGSIKEIKE